MNDPRQAAMMQALQSQPQAGPPMAGPPPAAGGPPSGAPPPQQGPGGAMAPEQAQQLLSSLGITPDNLPMVQAAIQVVTGGQ